MWLGCPSDIAKDRTPVKVLVFAGRSDSEAYVNPDV